MHESRQKVIIQDVAHLCTSVEKHLLDSLAGDAEIDVQTDDEKAEEVKENCLKWLALCDKRNISLATYHEIAQLCPSIPRKHEIVEVRDELNEIVEKLVGLTSTEKGVYVDCQKVLLWGIKSQKFHMNDDTHSTSACLVFDGRKHSKNIGNVSFNLMPTYTGE